MEMTLTFNVKILKRQKVRCVKNMFLREGMGGTVYLKIGKFTYLYKIIRWLKKSVGGCSVTAPPNINSNK